MWELTTRKLNQQKRNRVSLILLSFAGLLALGGVNAAPDNQPPASNQPQRYIVQLQDKSLSNYLAQSQSQSQTQSAANGKNTASVASNGSLLSVKATESKGCLSSEFHQWARQWSE